MKGELHRGASAMDGQLVNVAEARDWKRVPYRALCGYTNNGAERITYLGEEVTCLRCLVLQARGEAS